MEKPVVTHFPCCDLHNWSVAQSKPMWQAPTHSGHHWFAQHGGGRRQEGASELPKGLGPSEPWLWGFKLLGQLALQEKRLSYDWAPPQP